MDGLGSAASAVAVIDLSAKVASLCLQYLKEVKNAKSDIERLLGELDRLKVILEGAQQLLQGSNGARLQTSRRLRGGLQGCSSQLTELQTKLEKKLNTGATRRTMSRLGIHALKWPFESKDVDGIVTILERYRDLLSAALTIDQTAQVLDISQTLVLSKLPIAKDAAFDSHADEHNAQCHPETRVALRQEITRWTGDPQGGCIFWLNGMAGTGKSTISRTVAQSFADKGDLGASFFFKRGERDRSSAALLFTTIAAELAAKVPALAADVGAAIDADRTVTGKALKEQFEKLILEPLRNLKNDPGNIKKIVLVIDALDECERDDDIRVIIHLLSQAKTVSSVRFRAFVTSRPELPIRLGFNDIRGKYQDLVLHEIPRPVIEHDITVFLDYKLGKIRLDYNGLCRDGRQLPPDWPGPSIVGDLVKMAVPLFIFAATVCRFIEDQAWSDPAGQLGKVLQYRSRTQQSEINKLNATYRPVLDQLVVEGSKAAKRLLVEEFRSVVGSIVLLVEPLSTSSLAHLLRISGPVIDRRLACLHSVLSVPASAESPVRMFHLSFRDFLVDPDKRDSNPFWVDETATHGKIATKCIELMSSSGHLRKNLCDLKMPGTARTDIEPTVIESCLPEHVRYACLYWVYHLEQSNARITDGHQAYLFLKRHFLHWLEVLSLLGKISESIAMISSLQGLICPGMSADAAAFLHDAARFILNCHSTIGLRPLQIYSSAIIFAPEKSVIRNTFKGSVPEWISMLPNDGLGWNACLQTLKVSNDWVNAVVFSPDGNTLASASKDGTIRLWDLPMGNEKQRLEGHSGPINALTFSPDGKILVSASDDSTIRLWDPTTGDERQRLEGHRDWVKAITFSPDGRTLASASKDATIRLWDPIANNETRRLEGHTNYVKAVAFSPDGNILASASTDSTIRLWDLPMGNEKQRLEGHNGPINALTFSPDGKILVSASDDSTIRLWDPTTGVEKQSFQGHSNFVRAVAFSPDGRTFASSSKDLTVRLWDLVSGKHRTLKGHKYSVNAVAFSSDGKTLASASNDGTVRLWDPATADQEPRLGHSGQVNAVAFSPDGATLASASSDHTIRLWDPATAVEKQIIKGHSGWVNSLIFSSDGRTLASASSDRTIRLWDPTTGDEVQRLKGHRDWASVVAFSPDGKTLASASYDRTIRLWDRTTGHEKRSLEMDEVPKSLSFSRDSCYLKTDRALLTLNFNFANTFQEEKLPENRLSFSEDRVVCDGEEVLWLLQSSRPSCVASYNNTLALGLVSGMVTFIRFAHSKITHIY